MATHFTRLITSLLEQVKKFPGDFEWSKEILTEYELIIDRSVQPIQKLIDKQEQEEFYDGYRRIHGMKNKFIVLPKGKDIIDGLLGIPAPSSEIILFR